MNAARTMRKYYIAMAIFGGLVCLLVAVTFIGNRSLRHDYDLEKKITEVETSIEKYVSSRSALPELLPDAGVKDSGGVEYKKVSESRYLLCATFRSKSDGYSQPDQPYVNDVMSDSKSSGASLSNDTHFTNGTEDGLKHEKGYTCIVYSPYSLSEERLKPYTACNGKRFKSSLAQRDVVAVNAQTGQLSLKQTDIYAPTKSVTLTIQAKEYTTDKDTLYFDATCQKITLDQIKVGDTVTIYRDSTSATKISAIEKE